MILSRSYIKHAIIMFLFAGISYTDAFAQEQYQTSAGLLNITAYLDKNPVNIHLIGNGHLEHLVEGTSNACVLSLTFKLELDKVYPERQLAGLSNEIYVEVRQSLLARVND